MSGTPVSEMTLEHWNDVIATDLTGSFLTSRRFVRDLKGQNRRAAIINISSIQADVMRAGGADYDAAKGGQANLIRTMALEVARRGIAMNAIAPGKALHDPGYRDKLTGDIPPRRAGGPAAGGRRPGRLPRVAGRRVSDGLHRRDRRTPVAAPRTGRLIVRFEVERIKIVSLDGPDELLARNLMSPFALVGEDDAGVRAVPPDRTDGQEGGRLWFGHSGSDGLVLQMDARPMLVLGDGPDSHGCEDPALVQTDEGLVVYDPGVDAETRSHLCDATGPNARSLRKRRVALTSSKSERNTEEVTVARGDGRWRLLYGQSLISLADAPGPAGPWDERRDPFSPRPDKWDSWHLSAGPLLLDGPACPVMFYKGADWGHRLGGAVAGPHACQSAVRRYAHLATRPCDRPTRHQLRGVGGRARRDDLALLLAQRPRVAAGHDPAGMT